MAGVRSSLYECNVMHHRFAPRTHRFVYRIFMIAVDLDDLASLARGIPFLSVNGRNLLSFMEGDYLPTGEPLHNARTKTFVKSIGALDQTKYDLTTLLALQVDDD